MKERAERRAKGWLVGALAAAALVFVAGVTRAQTIDELRKAQNERHLVELRQQSAEAASIFEQAGAAYEADRYAEAEALYARVLALAPSFDPAARRRARALGHVGRHAEALDVARGAYGKEASDENASVLATTIAANPASDPKALDKAMGYASTAAGHRPDEPWAHYALCSVALRAQRPLEIDSCSRELMTRWPASHEGYALGSVSAALKSDWGRARELLEGAKARGLPPEAYASLDRSLDETGPFYRRWGRRARPMLVLWAGALGLLVAAGLRLRRAALRAAGRVPREATGRAQGVVLPAEGKAPQSTGATQSIAALESTAAPEGPAAAAAPSAGE